MGACTSKQNGMSNPKNQVILENSKVRVKPTIRQNTENLKSINLKKMNRRVLPALGGEISPFNLESPGKKSNEGMTTPMAVKDQEADEHDLSREFDVDKSEKDLSH